MAAADSSAVAVAWERHSLPSAVAGWLRDLAPGGRGDVYRSRAQRFVEFANVSFEQQSEVQKAWGAVARHALATSSDPAELAVFIRLPDRPEYNPHALLYGGHRLDRATVVLERKRYAKLRQQAAAVRQALGNSALRHLLQDTGANPNALQAATLFRRDHLQPLVDGLGVFEALLRMVDPAHKVPTAQHSADDAAAKVFVGQVASLNQYLAKPQHAALVRLAMINCSDATLNADQVRKAWTRMDKQG
jgi:hypothetical protein